MVACIFVDLINSHCSCACDRTHRCGSHHGLIFVGSRGRAHELHLNLAASAPINLHNLYLAAAHGIIHSSPTGQSTQ